MLRNHVIVKVLLSEFLERFSELERLFLSSPFPHSALRNCVVPLQRDSLSPPPPISPSRPSALPPSRFHSSGRRLPIFLSDYYLTTFYYIVTLNLTGNIIIGTSGYFKR